MHSSSFLHGALFLALGVSAETACRTMIPIHKVVTYGVMPINEDEHAPRIRGTVSRTLDCHIDVPSPTGGNIDMNHTILSQSGSSNNSCVIKNINGVPTIDSFQSIVIETNGWPLNDLKFDIHDIDASTLGWKEASAVFGLWNGTVVSPNISLSSISVLSPRNFDLPAESTRITTLQTRKISNIPGVVYSNSDIVNCHANSAPEKCGATVSFSSPVDTVAILYMLTARGSVLATSSARLSELETACGCRCNRTGSGNRLIAEPVPGLPGQCSSREVHDDKPECDPLGEQWCKIEPHSHYEVRGNTLPNGNIECEEKTINTPVIQMPFSAALNFSSYF